MAGKAAEEALLSRTSKETKVNSKQIDKRALFNIVQIGVAFLLFFVQFNSRGYISESVFANVAETSDIDPHAGYVGLSVYYLVFTFANLIISPVIDRFGLALSMAVGTVLTIFYEIGFFRINEYYYYVTSALSGFGGALLWPAMGTYLTKNSTEKTLERNSSILWALSQASQIIGGFILLIVFSSTGGDSITPSAMLGTSIVFTLSLVLALFTFLSLRKAPKGLNVEEEKLEKKGLLPELLSTFNLLLTKRMYLLAVVFGYTGIVQSFWTSIFPTCIFFTQQLSHNSMKWVAWSCICAGCGQISVSILTSMPAISSRLSRKIIVLSGCILHLIVFGGVFLYFPKESSLAKTHETSYYYPNPFMIMFLSYLLGIGDGCWNTQIYAILADIFPHVSNEAFALFNFYQSLMASFSLFYSSYIYLDAHLIILFVTASLGAVCFWIVEYWGKIALQGEEDIVSVKKENLLVSEH